MYPIGKEIYVVCTGQVKSLYNLNPIIGKEVYVMYSTGKEVYLYVPYR